MLDEYVGLPADHPQRYRNVIQAEFVDKVDIDPAQVFGPDGLAEDLASACEAYERAIADAGGVDLQILGIGTDGHIAFNEPGSSLASRTRIKTLTSQTRRDNARFFGGNVEEVPQHCLTQGIGTILEARHIVLVAAGRGKAEAVHQLVEGPVSAMWPATALQLHHTSPWCWTPLRLRVFSSPRTTSRLTRANRAGKASSVVLTTLLPGFAGTVLPVWLQHRLRAGLGGVCLYAHNISSPEQLLALTDAITAENPYAIIAIDEEGGDVTRLFAESGAPFPGNAVLGRLDDLDTTRDTAAAIGWALRRAGCTVDFAPCVDVNSRSDNPVIGVRSFSSDAEQVGMEGPGWLASSRPALLQAPSISRGMATQRRTHTSRYPLSTVPSTSCAGASCCHSPQPSKRGAGLS